MWKENESHANWKPKKGYEVSVTKWSRCWHWAIDTDPSSILEMDFSGPCSRIVSMPGGTYLNQGRAKTKKAAKKEASQAWKDLNLSRN